MSTSAFTNLRTLWDSAHVSFLRRYVAMFILVSILLAVFVRIDRFADLAYGALRFGLIHLFVLVVRFLFFRRSLDTYVAKQFTPDFHALSPAHKVGYTLGMLAVYLLTGVLCFVL